jgi:hypothetical protein
VAPLQRKGVIPLEAIQADWFSLLQGYIRRFLEKSRPLCCSLYTSLTVQNGIHVQITDLNRYEALYGAGGVVGVSQTAMSTNPSIQLVRIESFSHKNRYI